ncbi:hypothetical protein KC333_g3547 [Hortaea werneckii]|nr:hypothetical protein KC333_g3547 [Hortaea werneckii]KAI7317163.1 hypothetical protein KC326_g4095 [Hortaea werneckii]
MLAVAARSTHSSACAACRLRANIISKQLARCRRPATTPTTTLPFRSQRSFTSTSPSLYPRARRGERRTDTNHELQPHQQQPSRPPGLSPEDVARIARQEFGDRLPEGALTAEEYRVYERLYGTPVTVDEGHEAALDAQEASALEAEEAGKTGVVRRGEGGEWEEVEYDEDELSEEELAQMDELDALEEGEDEMVMSDQLYVDDDTKLAQDMQDTMSAAQTAKAAQEAYEQGDEEGEGGNTRIHPLTQENKYGPLPSTIQLPKAAFVDPASLLLSGIPPVHIAEAAHRVFGGVGLPYSTSTPAIGKTMQPKPIQLDAYQSGMSDIEADTYLATIFPGMYASVMSVLAETRRRLGTHWAENLVKKAEAGELKILDAGGAGAGVLAVRELLRAEWERMHEDDQSDAASVMALAEADGKAGGANASAPLGSATVLTGADTLRKRASQLLENTTFIPRLPDYLHTEEARFKGKYDIVIAPHTLWQLREDYTRKQHTQNLWSLLSTDGGVMVMLEKGVPRGFEMIAAAREMLLETRISSPEARAQNIDISDPPEPYVHWEGQEQAEPLTRPKEKGMIIAPCTNHAGCPAYVQKGHVRGRRDICHFEQRYIRPPFLQKVLNAKDKNHEDVKFSYLAVMRGRDLREVQDAKDGFAQEQVLEQGKPATEKAFEGYGDVARSREKSEDSDASQDGEEQSTPHSLSLPRAILPPLKRRGHVILDLCTPTGTLERWTVPKSFSKQAYRDARKSSWGDLWALGAKTRVLRTVRGPKSRKSDHDMDVTSSKKGRKGGKKNNGDDSGVGVDEHGRLKFGEGVSMGEGGKMRGRKIKGIRDKRDKKGRRVDE